MALENCNNAGRTGWKWGDGTCFTGQDSRRRALREGIASELENKRAGSEFNYGPFEELTDAEFSKDLSLALASLEEAILIMATRNHK